MQEGEPRPLAKGSRYRITGALARRRSDFSELEGEVVILGSESKKYFKGLVVAVRNTGDLWVEMKVYKADASLLELVEGGPPTPEGVRDALAGGGLDVTPAKGVRPLPEHGAARRAEEGDGKLLELEGDAVGGEATEASGEHGAG